MRNQGTDSYKLRELRSKTNRELLSLIDRRLGAALELARSYDADLQMRAITEHEELCRLLQLVYEIPASERRRVEFQLDQLADLLNAAA